MTADDTGAPRKPGRPPVGKARKASTSITLDAEVLAAMRKEAERRGVSLSRLIEQMHGENRGLRGIIRGEMTMSDGDIDDMLKR